jgi:DNA processing protein
MPMSDLNQIIIGLLQLKGVGRHTIRELMRLLNHPKELPFREIVELGQILHIIPAKIRLEEIKKAIDEADQVIYECQSLKINITNYLDARFPDCLNFRDLPVLLFYKGDFEILRNKKRAAVIGSREATSQGADFAFQAGKVLAENDFTVISGLAKGCDYQGHIGCLSANGKTAAFLPSGLEKIYPADNQDLAERILEFGGCLATEYSHRESLQAYKFIERDRLQSGASQFVIVSNFSPKSGTVHTLNYAKELSRPVFTSSEIYIESRNGFDSIHNNKVVFEVLNKEDLFRKIASY